MELNDYQFIAMRTRDNLATEKLRQKDMFDFETHGRETLGNVINGCLGLSGEVGEFNDIIKKWIFHYTPFDEEHAKKELGDVLWYVALICDSFGWNMNEIAEMNNGKLKARYKNGFSVHEANNRAKGDI